MGAAGGVILLSLTHYVAYTSGVEHESNRQRLAIAGTTNAALVVARSIETAQAETTVEAVKNAQTDLSAIPDLRLELDGLRDYNAKLRGELSRASDAAKRGEAATGAAMVLSDMLRRAEGRIAELEHFASRSVELADRYDGALIRGRLCESISDSWREKLSGK